MAPFRKMFSRPVSSGWKPVPTSSSEPTRPRISARPVVGAVMRDRIFSSVLLPAPLRPMMPTTSPSVDLEGDVLERPELVSPGRSRRDPKSAPEGRREDLHELSRSVV